MTSWAERHRDADSEWRMERWTAEAVDCPRCGARGRGEANDQPAEHCVGTITGVELQAPAHPVRIYEARKPRP